MAQELGDSRARGAPADRGAARGDAGRGGRGQPRRRDGSRQRRGVLIYENLWAAPFASAMRRAGGQLIANGRIPIQAFIAAVEADEGARTHKESDMPLGPGRAGRGDRRPRARQPSWAPRHPGPVARRQGSGRGRSGRPVRRPGQGRRRRCRRHARPPSVLIRQLEIGRPLTGAEPGRGRPDLRETGCILTVPWRSFTGRTPSPRARQRADPLVGPAPGAARERARRVTPVDQVGVTSGSTPQAAFHQEGLEALGARPLDPDDGPDHARGEGHAGQGPGPVRQGHPPQAGRPEHPVGRGGVRLSGARRPGQGGPRRHGSRSPALPPASRRVRRSPTSSSPRPVWRWRRARTRSTWSSTGARSCRVTTRRCSTRSWRSRQPAARHTSR